MFNKKRNLTMKLLFTAIFSFIVCIGATSALETVRLDDNSFTVDSNPLNLVYDINNENLKISGSFEKTVYNDENGYGYYRIVIPESEVRSSGTSVTITYDKVGTYKGKDIGLNVTYTVYQYVEGNNPRAQKGAIILTIPTNLTSAGTGLLNSSYNKCSYEFFYVDTQQPVDVEDAIFTFNSLNYSPRINETIFFDQDMVSRISTVYLLKKSNNIEVINNASDPKLKNKYSLALSPCGSDNFIDVIGNPNYTYNSASIKYSGKLEFYIGSSMQEHLGNVYYAPSSAAITGSKPKSPVKYVTTKSQKREKSAIYSAGDTFTYEVDQKVNTLNEDTMVRYNFFSIVDSLPKEVDYVSAILYDENGKEVTDGNIAYEPTTHTVSWVANSDFLTTMPLKGETYTLKINVKLNSDMKTKTVNAAKTIINENILESNEVVVNAPNEETTVNVPNTSANIPLYIALISATLLVISVGIIIYMNNKNNSKQTKPTK